MNFETFEPVYEQILDDFRYGRAADEACRDVLVDLDPGGTLADVADVLEGRDVAIAAPGPTLPADLDAIRASDAVVAVSSAAPVLDATDVDYDVYVTDLDAEPERAPAITDAGVPTAIHAHGDNEPAIREVVPDCDRSVVLGTTQAAPRGPVVNVGGFTDGDRAAFLADHVGASTLSFPGWDLFGAHGNVTPEKRRKLAWGTRLLRWLEVRRDERFAVLDGHRDDLDVASFDAE